MNQQKKQTFKLSLLDCFVIMITLSITLSVDVFAYKSGWDGHISNYWWRKHSMLDGILPLFIFHATAVIVAVMYARTIRALYRKERLGADDPVPLQIEPVAEEPVPPPPPEITAAQRAVGNVVGCALVSFGVLMSLASLAVLLVMFSRPVGPEEVAFFLIGAVGSLSLGKYVLNFVNPQRKSVLHPEKEPIVRPVREPMEIQNWFIALAIILFLLVVILTINNAMKNF